MKTIRNIIILSAIIFFLSQTTIKVEEPAALPQEKKQEGSIVINKITDVLGKVELTNDQISSIQSLIDAQAARIQAEDKK